MKAFEKPTKPSHYLSYAVSILAVGLLIYSFFPEA
jgi:hypothetical protein